MGSREDTLRKISTSDMDGAGNGGLLNPEQAKKFFDSVVDESTFMQYTRNIFMKSPVMEIDKLSLGRVATAGIESVAPSSTQYVGITTSKIELTTKKIIVPWSITYETLEDNIEGDGFEDTMIKMVSRQFANDIEELAIDGDTTSLDPYLALQNGLKQLIDGVSNVVTYATAPKLGKAVFSDLIKAMPTKYRRDRGRLVFFVGSNAEQDYRDTVSARSTGMGDDALVTNGAIRVYGIDVVPVPFLDDTWAVLMPKNNFIVGMHRSMRLEKDRNIMSEVNLYKISTRLGFEIEDTDAIAYTKTLDY